jgi:hypothetical protein
LALAPISRLTDPRGDLGRTRFSELVAHQLDEARDGVALIAMTVAVPHLAAAAVSGHLARMTGTQTP